MTEQNTKVSNSQVAPAKTDVLLEQAKEILVKAGKVSAALLQAKLKIGYARAVSILNALEEQGAIGPFVVNEPRKLLITKDDLPNTEDDKSKKLSDCCQSEITVVGGDEGTNHYECTKCHKACNVVPVRKKGPRLPKGQLKASTKDTRADEFNPKRQQFILNYFDKESITFGNVYQSAVKAGFSKEYAENITSLMPKWLSEIIGKLQGSEDIVEKAERVANEILDMRATKVETVKFIKENPEEGEDGIVYEPVERPDSSLLKIKNDMAKFILEGKGKDKGYGRRTDIGLDAPSIGTLLDLMASNVKK